MTSLSSIENDAAFARQMAELNAMLAAVTATCRAAEAEAISLRDQLASLRSQILANDKAYSRQLRINLETVPVGYQQTMEAALAAATETCQKAEAEAISLRDQLAAERKAREDLEKGWQRTYNHDCILLIKRAETARSDALEEAAEEMDAWDKQTVCTIRPAAAIRALKEVP